MVRYYIGEDDKLVRSTDGVVRYFDFKKRDWVFDDILLDIFIGEYKVKPISESDAMKLIRSK